MSSQYNGLLDERFELYSEEHALVIPDSFATLTKALQVREMIQEGLNGLLHDEESSNFSGLLEKQDEYIREFIDKIGEFDNGHLVNNINYIAKTNGLRLGELEKILGISAGYISRTAKENSSKKLSIDVVWKLAKLFGVDLHTLLETSLQIPNSNTDIIVQFLNKLRQQTEENQIHWTNCGGCVCYLDDTLRSIDFLSEEENGTIVYHPTHLNPDVRFILADDIYTCDVITAGKKFAVIAYYFEGRESTYSCDFYFFREDTHTGKTILETEKAFFSTDDTSNTITCYAEQLMNRIQQQEMDASIPSNAKTIIVDYLKAN